MKRQKTTTILMAGCVAVFILVLASAWAQTQSQEKPSGQTPGQTPGQTSGQAGQQKPAQQPPPYTKEEYDTYQKINQEPDAKKKVEMAEEFLKKYPASKLELFVRYAALPAYQQLNDAEKVIECGERVLQLQSDDVRTMTLLAWVYGERAQSNPAYKDKAVKHAEAAMGLLEKMQKPEGITDQQWADAKTQFAAMNDSTLGYIHLLKGFEAKEKPEKEKEFSKAVEMFQKALSLNKKDDLSWYRLGLAYAEQNKAQEAINSLAKAVALKGTASDFARKDLERIYKKLHKDSLDGLDDVIKKAGEELQAGANSQPAKP
jgi:tetratricopeptide (TPR) repeat protein